mmetsp:Transcript_4687/g.7037  ORF Transcript_4687/g.7037 Transcript_4687/m.7037 type:complete len:506 (-) Transcript_4687:2687-4204(-)
MSKRQVQLGKLLKTENRYGTLHEIAVPQVHTAFSTEVSSKGKNVLIPDWITVSGIVYNKLEKFPNTKDSISAHAGAHGCVAAYQVDRECYGSQISMGLPFRVALKCSLFGRKRSIESLPWASEWKIHEFMSNCFHEESPFLRESSGFVQCLGGVSATVSRRTQVFIAMELVDTDLFTMIERSATMSNFGDWILKALYSTSKALMYMHYKGIIYCDLKPENVLVNITTGEAKFSDFDRSCIPGLSVGVVGGTKGYYSPERMKNSNIRTRADDAWALGVLIIIGATTSASPYLEYDEDNVHKFVPSKYLKKYCRCDWSPGVVALLGDLCDQLLQVNRHNRANVDLALATLGPLVDPAFDAAKELYYKYEPIPGEYNVEDLDEEDDDDDAEEEEEEQIEILNNFECSVVQPEFVAAPKPMLSVHCSSSSYASSLATTGFSPRFTPSYASWGLQTQQQPQPYYLVDNNNIPYQPQTVTPGVNFLKRGRMEYAEQMDSIIPTHKKQVVTW